MPNSNAHAPRLRACWVLTAALLACSPSELAAQRRRGAKSENWPFGLSPAQASDPMVHKRDLFNLGMIGAKAWDATRKEPAALRSSGRRQFRNDSKSDGDAGPTKLVVRALLGGAPAQRAGLQLGDEIVGIGQQKFDKGCFQPFADALTKAEAETGVVVLDVLRAGKQIAVTVKLKKGGKEFSEPTKGKARDKILAAALQWLAEHQEGDGGYPATLGGMNGRVVNACLAGLAWLAGGSTARAGKYRTNIHKAEEFVVRGLWAKDTSTPSGAGANWDQSTWRLAYASLFLGELLQTGKNPKLRATLQKIADELAARQEVSGGYGHGPGGKNALGYIELNILGALVMSGLGQAKQAGCKIADPAIQKLDAYLQASAGEDGGVGYADGPGQKGMGNIGRTAAAWLGAVGLGRRADPWTKKMEGYVRAHVADVMHGHASLMQHITLAGVAAKALGSDAEAAYWKVMQRDMTLARAPDGSLQSRPWHESLLMESNTDVSMGEVWTTASWAIVLGAEAVKAKKGGLPGWCGKNSSQ
ncbi:MAG: hypothetical protein H6836_06775 [Planctomycetes bacterium]|nr:hypothetical protein [Planctomycetota bacterium]